MANRDEDLGAEIPEGDYAEQLTPVEEDEHPTSAAEPDGLVDEADWMEQQRLAPLDDDRESGASVEG